MDKAPFYNDLAEGPKGGSAWWLMTQDGRRVRVGHWPGGDKGTVLLFPGRTEYIEKFGRSATMLGANGYGTVCIDWRGQGMADRLDDDPMLGHIGHFTDYQMDVAALVAFAREQELPQPWFLLAHSMGGCIGLRALHQGLAVNAAVFSAPMWGIGMSDLVRPFAWAVSYGADMIHRGTIRTPGTKPGAYVQITAFKDNTLTGDPNQYAYMQRHVTAVAEFGLGGPSLRWLHQALLETRKLRAKKPPSYPAMTFLGGREEIVHRQSVHDVMQRWENAEFVIDPEAKHEFPMETAPIRTRFFTESMRLFAQNA